MNILLVYLKVCDDEIDDGKLSDKLKRIIFSVKADMIAKKYHSEAEIIRNELSRLAEIEKKNDAKAVSQKMFKVV